MSWDEAYADRYDEWSADMTEDVPFYAELAREADGPIVELAVGNGRVAIPVALATGRPVIGIDTSPSMLAQARTRAAEADVELVLREGDMRDLELDEPAALVYCPFRALLHLPTWADRRRTFERVAASLRPNGRFAWNAFAFDHAIAARLDGEHQADPSRTHCGTRSATTGSTSSSTTTASALSGGRRRTNGSASSTSRASRSRRSTGRSTGSRSTTRAASTSSSRAAPEADGHPSDTDADRPVVEDCDAVVSLPVLQPVRRRRRRSRRRGVLVLAAGGAVAAAVAAVSVSGRVGADEAPPAPRPAGTRTRAASPPRPSPTVRRATGVQPLVVGPPRVRRGLHPALSAHAAVVVDAATGRMLWGLRAHRRLPIASTTKIMTAHLVLQRRPLGAPVRISWSVPRVQPNREGLRVGERVPTWKLLYGLLLYSGNDDALALAIATAGSRTAFLRLMNEEAGRLGLRNTHFTSPSGVVDRGNYSTPADLAGLTRVALRDGRFREIVGTRVERVRWPAPTYAKVYVNKNRLLTLYPGAIGVKTGWTTKAGHCLVGAATRGGRTLIAVVLKLEPAVQRRRAAPEPRVPHTGLRLDPPGASGQPDGGGCPRCRPPRRAPLSLTVVGSYPQPRLADRPRAARRAAAAARAGARALARAGAVPRGGAGRRDAARGRRTWSAPAST